MSEEDRKKAIEIICGDSDIDCTYEELYEGIKNLSIDELKNLEEIIDPYIDEDDDLNEDMNILETNIDRIVNRLVALSKEDYTPHYAVQKACLEYLGRQCDHNEYDKINRIFQTQHDQTIEEYYGYNIQEKTHKDIDSDTVISSYSSDNFMKDVKTKKLKNIHKKGRNKSKRFSPLSKPGENEDEE